MKVGLIADIHGNLQALQRVLAFLDEAAADVILCAGDLVCYGAQHNEVLTLLRKRAIPSVMGNYDDAVAWNRPKASRKPSSERNEPLKQAALDWTKNNLHDQHLPFLRGLPLTSLHVVDGTRIRLLHAGVDFYDEWVTPDQPDKLLVIAQRLPADVIVLGHTHQSFSTNVDGTLFINPGAVGRSLDGDPRASFALFDTTSQQTTFFRQPYALNNALLAIRQSDMPDEIETLVRHAARRIEQLDTLAVSDQSVDTQLLETS